MRIPLVLSVETTDVGATQVASIYLNDVPIIHFYTATKHEDTSTNSAIGLAVSALERLLAEEIGLDNHCWVSPLSPAEIFERIDEEFK